MKDKTGKATTRKKIIERLLSSLLDVILLVHFKDDCFSAYDALTFVRERFGVLLSSANVYSKVYAMEREKLLVGFNEGRKRVYRVTELGKMTAEIATDASEMQAFISAILENSRPKVVKPPRDNA